MVHERLRSDDNLGKSIRQPPYLFLPLLTAVLHASLRGQCDRSVRGCDAPSFCDIAFIGCCVTWFEPKRKGRLVASVLLLLDSNEEYMEMRQVFDLSCLTGLDSSLQLAPKFPRMHVRAAMCWQQCVERDGDVTTRCLNCYGPSTVRCTVSPPWTPRIHIPFSWYQNDHVTWCNYCLVYSLDFAWIN